MAILYARPVEGRCTVLCRTDEAEIRRIHAPGTKCHGMVERLQMLKSMLLIQALLNSYQSGSDLIKCGLDYLKALADYHVTGHSPLPHEIDSRVLELLVKQDATV